MALYEEEERYRGGHQGGPFVHLVLVVVGEWPTQARVSKCPTTTTTCTFSSSQAATNAAADALNAEALLSRGAHSKAPSTICDSTKASRRCVSVCPHFILLRASIVFFVPVECGFVDGSSSLQLSIKNFTEFPDQRPSFYAAARETLNKH